MRMTSVPAPEMRVEPEVVKHAFGVMRGRVGQQHLAPGKPLEGMDEPAFRLDQGGQIVEGMGFAQEFMRIDAMMLDQPEQGGAVAPP